MNLIDLKTKFGKAILLGIALIVFFAYMDSLGYNMWATLGGFGSENYSNIETQYMEFFWTWAYVLIGLLGICYWYFVKKDKSETLAVILVPLILLWGGLEDILYYLFVGLPFSGTMPWLNNNFYMGNIARILGFENVTFPSLIISILFGIIILYYILKFLRGAKW